MIPKFPNFKKLELSDQKDIEAITYKYAPYSDFDFGNLICWYGEDNIELCLLNDNLVVCFKNEFNGSKKYSFLGHNKANQTIKILLDYIESNSVQDPELWFIPEESLQYINMGEFIVEIDFDNSDYVYNLTQLSFYREHQYAKKRQFANIFLNRNPHAETKVLDIKDIQIQSELLTLYDVWSKNKNDNENIYLKNERKAIHRLIDYDIDNILCIGVFVNFKLVGYSIFRKLPNSYAICYFSKIDVSYYGLNEFLMKASANKLILEGCEWLNYEEDMGIAGLRFSKNSFRPTHFLRKYTIKNR